MYSGNEPERADCGRPYSELGVAEDEKFEDL
jgi:hypothetical protein